MNSCNRYDLKGNSVTRQDTESVCTLSCCWNSSTTLLTAVGLRALPETVRFAGLRLPQANGTCGHNVSAVADAEVRKSPTIL